MRDDVPTDATEPSPTAARRRTTGFHAPAWAGPSALAALVAVTSLAVAVYASAWLVPPYLALMAVVLGVPVGRRKPEVGTIAGVAADVPADAGAGVGGPSTPVTRGHSRADVPSDPDTDLPSEPLSRASNDAPAGNGAEPTVVKTRRGAGKGRSRKAKAAATAPGASAGVEPAAATWVRIGPGKFVRADLVSAGDEPAAGTLNVSPEPPPDDPVGDEAMEAPGEPLREEAPEARSTEPDPEPSPVSDPVWPTVGATTEPAGTVVDEPVAGGVDGQDLGAVGGYGEEGDANGFGPVAAVGIATEDTGAWTAGDNGITPDAPVEPALADSVAAEPPRPGVEPDVASPEPDREPAPADPHADPAAESSDAPDAGRTSPPPDAATGTRPATAGPGRSAFGPLAALLRMRSRRGGGGCARAGRAGATRAESASGRGAGTARVRGGRPRGSGSDRAARRLRNAVRSPRLDHRTHPPRSPPASRRSRPVIGR